MPSNGIYENSKYLAEIRQKQEYETGSRPSPKWRTRCSQFCSFALIVVNLLLMLYVGAGLSTASRLKWDPSAYLAVRGFLPLEYKVLAVLLTAGSIALTALALLAIYSIVSLRWRAQRIALLTYGFLLTMTGCAEAVTGAWLLIRIYHWLQSDEALLILNALRLRKPLMKALSVLGMFIQFPNDINRYIEEAENDIPYNIYIGIGAIGLFAVLHVLAIILVLLLVRGRQGSHARSVPENNTRTNNIQMISRNMGSYDKSRESFSDRLRYESAKVAEPLKNTYTNMKQKLTNKIGYSKGVSNV